MQNCIKIGQHIKLEHTRGHGKARKVSRQTLGKGVKKIGKTWNEVKGFNKWAANLYISPALHWLEKRATRPHEENIMCPPFRPTHSSRTIYLGWGRCDFCDHSESSWATSGPDPGNVSLRIEDTWCYFQ